MQEFHYQLTKVIGMHSNLEGTSIPPVEWLGTTFIIGLDLEKAATSPAGAAAFTGLSTRAAGDTLRFSFEGVQPRDLRLHAAAPVCDHPLRRSSGVPRNT
jgi:hypothetical protein